MNTGTALTDATLPDQRMADLYFFGRWSPMNQAPVVFDCSAARAALLIDGAAFAEDGTITNADWQSMPEDDPILALVCET